MSSSTSPDLSSVSSHPKLFKMFNSLVSLELLDGEGVESLVYFWREVPFEDSVVCLRTQSFHEGGALVAG